MKTVKRNRNKRAGFSIAEAVIALAIIAIVSVGMMTMILSSVKVEEKSLETQYYFNYAENAVECFRFTHGDANAWLHYLNQGMEAHADGTADTYTFGEDTDDGDDAVRTYRLHKNGEATDSVVITLAGKTITVYITFTDGSTAAPITYTLGGA